MSSFRPKLSPKCWQNVQLLCDAAQKGLADCYSDVDSFRPSPSSDNHYSRLSMVLNLRYIIIAQIGIKHHLNLCGSNDLSLPDLWPHISSERDKVIGAGDLGLAIWAAVESNVDDCVAFVKRLVDNWLCLRKACNAVELAWIVQGMVRLSQHQTMTSEMTDLLRDAYNRLMGLYCQNIGLFARHNRRGFKAVVSRIVASFADQVYPILALANYGHVFRNDKSIEVAVDVADTICRMQGPKGQWWWHYDVRTGTVAEEYPVFSVHQDAMAPMALLAIDKVASTNHATYIERGLMWLNESNELQAKMILPQQGVIWRDIHRLEIGKMYRAVRGALAAAGWNSIHLTARSNLFGYVMNKECRPYHLGWILYTWAAQLSDSDTSADKTLTKIGLHSVSQTKCEKNVENKISNKTKTAVDILGLPVSPITMEQLLQIVDNHIASNEQLRLGVVNVAKVVNAQKKPQLRQSLQEADLILADGVPIVWLSKVLGTPLPERVAGIDFMFRLLKEASKKHYRVYFLGAKPEVLPKAIETVKREYPGIHIAGYRDGYFGKNQEQSIAEDIKDTCAHILFVGISSPKKEYFLKRWHKYMNVPVCHGVGGSFDILAGITKRAPIWMQKCGIEWFYRIIQEPRRMWKRYLITNTIFIKLSLEAIIRARVSRFFRRFTLKPASDTKTK